MSTVASLLDEAVVHLKNTTVGYKGHNAVWYASKTTEWALGLEKIDAAKKLSQATVKTLDSGTFDQGKLDGGS